MVDSPPHPEVLVAYFRKLVEVTPSSHFIFFLEDGKPSLLIVPEGSDAECSSFDSTLAP